MPPPARIGKITRLPDGTQVRHTTFLATTIQAAMNEQNLTQGDVERRGGPSKQTVGRILNSWTGDRSLAKGTMAQLSVALGIPERTLGRLAAVDMGLLPRGDAWPDEFTQFQDRLRDADPATREVVIAAAEAVLAVLTQKTAGQPQLREAARRGIPDKVRRELAEPDFNVDPPGPEGGA